jgi:conjugative transfer pilus assembly protein TraH
MTPLPVMKFLVVLNSAHYGDAAVDMQEYATLIAQDMMQQYLSELLLAVSNATQGSVLNESLLADVRQRIESANTRIAAIDPQVSRKLTQKLELINNVVRIEKQLSSSLKG